MFYLAYNRFIYFVSNEMLIEKLGTDLILFCNVYRLYTHVSLISSIKNNTARSFSIELYSVHLCVS